ncbi:SDR family oxidoreductase [Dapis sp. BLCC M126]|uniref:SDR family oxidoreductase n=1 Tax=Dapis sp. BLCC M126 TaxID=3400189 RepID=UPI003CF963B1
MCLANTGFKAIFSAKIFKVQRLGTPEDVAELISWLISPKSSFVSGTIIPVHGAR